MDGYWFFRLIKRTLYKNSSQPRAIILYRTQHICETNFKAFWKSHHLPNLSKKKPRQIYFNLLCLFLVCILINFYFVCYSIDLFCLILWSNVTLSYLVLYYWFFLWFLIIVVSIYLSISSFWDESHISQIQSVMVIGYFRSSRNCSWFHTLDAKPPSSLLCDFRCSIAKWLPCKSCSLLIAILISTWSISWWIWIRWSYLAAAMMVLFGLQNSAACQGPLPYASCWRQWGAQHLFSLWVRFLSSANNGNGLCLTVASDAFKGHGPR